ncbi:5207_t:CDS:1, partial [Acaulospora colombiana]
RSAKKPSAKGRSTPLASKRGLEPSPSKATGSRLPLALDEVDERSDDEHISPIEISSALAATRSMPELNESLERQEFPIAFLHDLVENQKKTQKGSAIQGSPERSTDAETQSSLSSREYRSWSRFHRGHAEASFRVMTQRAVGVNPPGITVHSQSQSDHAPHQNAFSEGRGDELEEETQPVTLVVGTPSSTSEFSHSDKALDMSQLRRDGQALLNYPDDGTDIATQSIRASDEVLIPTQVITGEDGQETLDESKNGYLIQGCERGYPVSGEFAELVYH